MTRLASWADYGTHDESAYPELWRGCVGAWAPCLGPTGTRLHDLSRYRNWGTLTNMDAATDWVVSGGRCALDLDGINDRVFVADSASLRPPRSITISFHIFLRALSGVQRVIDKQSATPFYGYSVFFNGNKLYANVAYDTNGAEPASATTFATGLWYAISVSYSGARLRYYVNGLIDTDTPASGTISYITSPDLSFGKRTTIEASFTNALIDDVRIYDRDISPFEARLLATRRGIAFERQKRKQVFFNSAFFNPAWARNSNVILSPVGAA